MIRFGYSPPWSRVEKTLLAFILVGAIAGGILLNAVRVQP